MNAAIQTVGLTKRFGARTALAGADLQLPSGGITGLLGPHPRLYYDRGPFSRLNR